MGGSATTPRARSHAPGSPIARSASCRRRGQLPSYISDWPKNDPDLASLHDRPEFIAMFGRAESSSAKG
jgi:hypothetical protein